jgi:hypothetical protein
MHAAQTFIPNVEPCSIRTDEAALEGIALDTRIMCGERHEDLESKLTSSLTIREVLLSKIMLLAM